ncbi:MAG TPA: hypothetical protein VH442_02745, partial [Micromonosporaceae bacterium]
MVASPAFAAPSDSPSPSPSSPNPSVSVPAGSKTFTIGTLQDVDSLNPYAGFLVMSAELYADTYDTLQNLS